MFNNLKLLIKLKLPFFFFILKKIKFTFIFFKKLNTTVIINILFFFKIQFNTYPNPLININLPFIINLAGFDGRFSLKLLNFLFTIRNFRIYDLNKIKKKINLLKKNTTLNYRSDNNDWIPFSVLETFIHCDSDFRVNKFHKKKINFKDYIYLDNKSQNLIIISHKWAFFHFFLQIIPFIIHINNKKKYNVLLRKKNTKFFQSLIKIFFNKKISDINLKKFQFQKKFELFNNNIYPNRQRILELREFLRKKFKLNYHNRVKNFIYVKRTKGSTDDAFKRKIINEHKLINILKYKYNFKIIDPLKINNIQQIKIFNQCKGILSLHGANLSNIIVANKNCKILELNKNFDIRWHYYKISNDIGISKNHKFLITKTKNKKMLLNFDKNFFNLLNDHFKN